MVSIFGQWAGNGVLTYYQGAVLDTAGIKDQTQQLNVNLGISCSSFAIAVIGALCVDRLGRRSLLLFTNLACCLCWVALTVSSSMYAGRGGTSDKNEPAPPAAIAPGTATLAFMYIFNLVYSFGFTPLQALYPVEILSFEMRAKGMGFSGLAVSIGNLINQFAWPIALANIQWRTYIIFCIWCFIQFVCIYFFIPETRNRTVSSQLLKI
jgi:MFS family permease